ncbi:hypothetical protein BS47DRAFT_1482179 [Hydnum rufescens UP504]|uniref:PWWP domain-containing protein n=1 Tax=Hydnum rufescens UP504 TaxID=1448309 RepID=A0A9P6B870_9AGAM|nr:hypothetical protein BS47DRAFT_1482179 [Hydnum rufescens UP504]
MASSSSKKSSNHPTSYTIGETVLAKIKGYPPWPGQIVDPEAVPKAVTKDRPKSTKTQFYCVRFFPAGDHAWQVPKDLSKLLPHEIDAYINEPSKKNGELLSAYRIAKDPTEWESEQRQIRKENEEAEKNAPVDELDEDEEAETGEIKSTSKKRKRDSDVDKKAKAKTPENPKKNGAISAPSIVESEDEGAADGDKKEDLERPVKRAKKGDDDDEGDEVSDHPEATRVKSWRHELQRAFLPKTGDIKAEDMAQSSETLRLVEDYTPKLTVGLMSSSKIGKVMRKIGTLPEGAIPNEDEFKIRERANKLLQNWGKIINPSSAPVENGAAAPVAGGDTSMTDADAVAEPEPVNGEGAKADDKVPDVEG